MDMVRRNSLDIELSVAPVDCIRSLRKLCEEKNWSLERHEGARLVDRFAIIMPMAQSARTLGLKVLDGPLMGLELTTWSEVRGSAGAVHICSWILPGGLNIQRFSICCSIGLPISQDVHGDGRLESDPRLDSSFQRGRNHVAPSNHLASIRTKTHGHTFQLQNG